MHSSKDYEIIRQLKPQLLLTLPGRSFPCPQKSSKHPTNARMLLHFYQEFWLIQNVMEGFPIDLSQNLGSLGSLFLGAIEIFQQGGGIFPRRVKHKSTYSQNTRPCSKPIIEILSFIKIQGQSCWILLGPGKVNLTFFRQQG